MHLDLVVDDLDAGVAEMVALGARLAPVQYAPERCRVLIDPAGHPFCLCPQRPPFV
nr:VOC family protein [Gordonia shandongensis]